MITHSTEADLSLRWKATLRNTGVFPWVETEVTDRIKLRCIPAECRIGEYLMDIRGVDNTDPATTALCDPDPRVWIGITTADHDLIVQQARSWLTNLEDGVRARLEDVVIIVGPDLNEVTAGMSADGAFVAPEIVEGRTRFLVCLSYPKTIRSRYGEECWLRSALTHELEHVYQYLASESVVMELPWRPVAEMCAVYAEYRSHPQDNAVQDFAVDFLRRLPEGLLTTGGIPSWCFLFIQQLEKASPDIHRRLWEKKGKLSRPRVGAEEAAGAKDIIVLEQGPWLCLNRLLSDDGASLTGQWHHFCRNVIGGQGDPLHVMLEERFAGRFPTKFFDLAASEGEVLSCDFWPLSAHWVRVKPDPARPRTLRWVCQECADDTGISVSVARIGEDWHEEKDFARDCEGEIIVPAGGPVLDLLFTHGCAPDMRLLYYSPVGHRYQLGAAQLTIAAV